MTETDGKSVNVNIQKKDGQKLETASFWLVSFMKNHSATPPLFTSSRIVNRFIKESKHVTPTESNKELYSKW